MAAPGLAFLRCTFLRRLLSTGQAFPFLHWNITGFLSSSMVSLNSVNGSRRQARSDICLVYVLIFFLSSDPAWLLICLQGSEHKSGMTARLDPNVDLIIILYWISASQCWWSPKGTRGLAPLWFPWKDSYGTKNTSQNDLRLHRIVCFPLCMKEAMCVPLNRLTKYQFFKTGLIMYLEDLQHLAPPHGPLSTRWNFKLSR
jgi:hypothetical protein